MDGCVCLELLPHVIDVYRSSRQSVMDSNAALFSTRSEGVNAYVIC